jgi:ATP:ADP antiporter, AAA family
MKILDILKQNDLSFRKNLLLFVLAYFTVLFNYPLIRSSTTSLFFESFGAKASPMAWLWAVLFLSFSIFVCNKLQKHFKVQIVFAVATIFSSLVFLSGNISFFAENKFFAFLAFIWKEIAIVLQVHLLLAYANSYFKKEDFKRLIGPIGAMGSLGGIFGGLLTSYLSNHGGTLLVLHIGIIFVLLPLLFFSFTKNLFSLNVNKLSPLESLQDGGVKKYVFYICSMVALTQFIINIADFQFNLAFELSVPTSDLRTGYLGQIYTWTNALTFVFQFVVLPYILPRIKERNLHLFIPLSYLICVLALMMNMFVGLLPIAMLYIYFKAADYSFFSAGKEILYQPLASPQKYGAKYLTDMLVYRSSKAFIALLLIYVQSSSILNMMMLGFLFIWLAVVVKLFQHHKKIFT